MFSSYYYNLCRYVYLFKDKFHLNIHEFKYNFLHLNNFNHCHLSHIEGIKLNFGNQNTLPRKLSIILKNLKNMYLDNLYNKYYLIKIMCFYILHNHEHLSNHHNLSCMINKHELQVQDKFHLGTYYCLHIDFHLKMIHQLLNQYSLSN